MTMQAGRFWPARGAGHAAARKIMTFFVDIGEPDSYSGSMFTLCAHNGLDISAVAATQTAALTGSRGHCETVRMFGRPNPQKDLRISWKPNMAEQG